MKKLLKRKLVFNNETDQSRQFQVVEDLATLFHQYSGVLRACLF